MSILVSAIIICLLIIMALYLSIKLDYANGEKEYYKKENERLQEKNRDLCMKVAKYTSKRRQGIKRGSYNEEQRLYQR